MLGYQDSHGGRSRAERVGEVYCCRPRDHKEVRAELRRTTCICIRRTPHPVIVTIRDTSNYIKVLLYSYYTTIT